MMRWISFAAALTATASLARAAPARPDDPCESWGCGGNTPEMFGVLVHGLSVAGVEHDGVKLQPTTITVDPAKCPLRPSGLRVRDGELVVTDARGATCTGTQLLRASFEVVLPDATGRIFIAAIDKVSTWEADRTKARYVTTYRFTAGEGGPGVCKLLAWMEPWQVGNLPGAITGPTADAAGPPGPPPPPPPLEGQAWPKPSDHAVLVHGEIYQRDATIAKRGAEWFSIGCAGSAVAKMRLFGYNPRPIVADPSNRASTESERVATLKMLTAKYRGARSYTVYGMPLLWLPRSGLRYLGDPSLDDPLIGPIESHWSSTGARCLSHLRRSRRSIFTRVIASAEDSLRLAISGGVVPPCAATTPSSLVANGLPDGIEWVTFTYDHISHPP